MNEFTPEWIEGQRKIIKDGTMTIAEMKKDFQLNRLKREAKQITCEANYPHALDEIQRLQARVQELEDEKQAGWKEWLDKQTELEAEQRWIPVSERLPDREDGLSYGGVVDCLIYLSSYNKIFQASYYPKMSVWNMPSGYADEYYDITHWMREPNIPLPPKEE